MHLSKDKPLLKFDKVDLFFGNVQALVETSFDLKKGEILGIIGPNGAGKTCILNCISGYYRPDRGMIWYGNHNLNKMSRHHRPAIGIARTFQNIELFKGLTTIQNLLLGRHHFMKGNLLSQAIYLGWYRRKEIEHRGIVEDILDFLEMTEIRNKVVGTLAYGLQKRVQLGQALAMEPKLLLLDEPMAGMIQEEKEDMARFILDIKEAKDITMILIEHDMEVVMDICDRIAVLNYGRKIAEGLPHEIKVNPEVIAAYLGE
jgi:branched-chain amino acid transport system ATP-binding protein